MLWAAVAAGVVVLVVGAGAWLLARSPASSQDSSQDAAESPRAAVEESAVQTNSDESGADRVMAMLPAGYPSQACAAVDPPAPAVAAVDCARNLDPGGPANSTYTVITERTDLDAAFAGIVDGLDVVVCPGNIQSGVHSPFRQLSTNLVGRGAIASICSPRGEPRSATF